MRVAVNAVALLILIIPLQVATSARAAEEESDSSEIVSEIAEDAVEPERRRQDGHDQWLPSLAIIAGVGFQDWKGSVESSICPSCPDPPVFQTLRPSDDGSEVDVTPFMGAQFELMTPELPIVTSPRFFVGGEIFSSFGFERTVAGEGDPSSLRSPLPVGAGNAPYGENFVLGQGSETLATLDHLAYGLHGGVAFPFELYGRQLRLKPSFAWTRFSIDVSGLVVDAECTPTVGTSSQCNTVLPNGFQREIRLEASESRTWDAIGPGLDLELDTGRFGPLGSSLFLSGRILYILGDRTIVMSASRAYQDVLGSDLTRAQFSFEVDSMMYRIGLGFRVHWLGDE